MKFIAECFVFFRGVHKWALQIAKARFYMRSKYASVDIKIMKAEVDEEKGTILVHWRCKAVPQFRILLLWKFLPWNYRKTLDTESELVLYMQSTILVVWCTVGALAQHKPHSTVISVSKCLGAPPSW